MIVINPTYESLQAQLSAPEELVRRGTLIHKGRNELYVTEVDDIPLCIKCFGFANRLKRFIYRYVRSSKGLRAWQNSLRLRAAGFATPEPVAYIQEDSLWGVERSFYICLYQEGKTLYRWGEQPFEATREDVIALAHFAANIHNANMLLCDFTPGNILLGPQGFTLVDTNRMCFKSVSVRAGLRNMAGLWLSPEAAALLAHTYGTLRGAQPEQCEQWYKEDRRHFWRCFARRHHLTDRITHHDLDGSQYTYDFKTTIQ